MQQCIITLNVNNIEIENESQFRNDNCGNIFGKSFKLYQTSKYCPGVFVCGCQTRFFSSKFVLNRPSSGELIEAVDDAS